MIANKEYLFIETKFWIDWRIYLQIKNAINKGFTKIHVQPKPGIGNFPLVILNRKYSILQDYYYPVYDDS
jgi:hypothetical protein